MFSMWTLGNCFILACAHLGLSKLDKNMGRCLISLSRYFPWKLVFTLVFSISLESLSSLFLSENSIIVSPITHIHNLWFLSLSLLFCKRGLFCKMVLLFDHASAGRKFPANILCFEKAHCRKFWKSLKKPQQKPNPNFNSPPPLLLPPPKLKTFFLI